MHSEPLPHVRGRESIVGIATRCGLDYLLIGPQGPPIHLYNGNRVFSGVRRPKGSADYPPPSTAGLRMGWSYTSASSFTLHIRPLSMVLGNCIPIQCCNEFNKFKIKKKLWGGVGGVMYGTSL
jgi:hypothetical protein